MMIEVEMIINEDGSQCTELMLNSLEDLYHDYLDFIQQAEHELAEDRVFIQKRYLRASLIIFTAYFNGVADQWCQAEMEKEHCGSKEIEERLRHGCLEKKFKYLKERSRVRASTPCFGFKEIRNRIVHPQHRGKPGDFYSLKDFHSLTPKLVRATAGKVIGWLDQVGGVLGYRRHVNSDTLMTKRTGLTSSISTRPVRATPIAGNPQKHTN